MLGGCCAFGVVAYEIAQQLQELGHRVELLILFDAVNPYFMRQYSALRTRLAYHQAALKKMRWSEVPGWMAAKLAGLIARNSGGLGGTVAMDDDQARFAAQFGFSSERIAAVRKYRPRPYAGRLLLFKSHRPLGGRYRDERFGWGETVRGKIEACQLGTDNHLEIFKSESDRALVAQKVRSSLDEIASTLTAEDFGIARNSERRVG
jgi:thioesterase domain-containing protein